MPRLLVRLWRDHRAALLLLGVSLTIALFFAIRLIVFTIYWSDPANRDVRLEGWMTVGFVAHAWHLPPEDVLAMIPYERTPGEPPTLALIAARKGEPLPALIDRLEAGLCATRQQDGGNNAPLPAACRPDAAPAAPQPATPP